MARMRTARRSGSTETPRPVNMRSAQASITSAGSQAAQPKPCTSTSLTCAPSRPARLAGARSVAVESEGSAPSWLPMAMASTSPAMPATTPPSSFSRRRMAARTAGEAKRPKPEAGASAVVCDMRAMAFGGKGGNGRGDPQPSRGASPRHAGTSSSAPPSGSGTRRTAMP